MQSYLTSPMVVPEPDLARIVIHRSKGDAGEEEQIAVDLRRAISSLTAQTTAEQARQLDVPLQWGDVVEIPQLTEARLTAWTGFDPATVRFLSRALSRTVTVWLNGEKLDGPPGEGFNQLAPVFAVFSYDRVRWHVTIPEGPRLLPNSPEQMRSRLPRPLTVAQLFRNRPLERFWPDRVVRVVVRPGSAREFDARALQKNPPWLFPDDHVLIETLDDAMK
jgi:hypothetical protein